METKEGDTVRSILNGTEYKVKKIVRNMAVLESQDGKSKVVTEFAEFDAETRFGVSGYTAEEDPECISGLVLRGVKQPHQCTAFGTRCTPEHPLGVTMVSSEGACAAYYRYRGVHAVAAE